MRKSVGVFSPDTGQKVSKVIHAVYYFACFQAAWDMMCFFFVLYQSIVVPYRICFEAEAADFFLVFETIIDVTFMLDIGTSLDLAHLISYFA